MTRHSRIAFLLIALIGTATASASSRFKYSELQIKDYDEMSTLVRERIKKAQAELDKDKDGEGPADQEVVEELRNALLLALSRPNQDNMLSKILPELRKEMVTINSFEDSLASIAGEALDGLGNGKLPTVYRSTYLFVLQNILNEFRPEIRDRPEIRKIFERIRDAKVEIPKEVAKDLRLRSMFNPESPSERAKRSLDSMPLAKPTPKK